MPDIPPDIEEVILKALTKDPADRYPRMGDMVAALETTSVCVSWPRLSLPDVQDRHAEKTAPISKEITLPWPAN